MSMLPHMCVFHVMSFFLGLVNVLSMEVEMLVLGQKPPDKSPPTINPRYKSPKKRGAVKVVKECYGRVGSCRAGSSL